MQANLGRVGVTTAEDTSVNNWIEEIIREDICADHSWSGMEFTRTRALTISTDKYAFANASVFKDCRWIMLQRVAATDYFLLDEVALDTIHDPSYFTEQTEGIPRVWARDGDSYVLRPIPDAAYAVRERVWEYPAALSGDSSTNFVTLYTPKLLEYGVTARACLFYGEEAAYQLWQGAYVNELAKAVGIDRKRLSPAKMTMRVSAAAGTPEPGLTGGIRHRRSPYDWL